MKVYFVGSHSTGKTTLSRYVSNQYQLPMISEVVRQVIAEMELSLEALHTDIGLADELQREVFSRQTQAHQKYPDGFVSDRAFDNIAYCAEHAMITSKLFASEEFADYVEEIKQDSVVFFVRPHRALLKEDGVRVNVTWDSVLLIDGMIKLLLELHGVDYMLINTPNMQERCRIIDFVLKRES